MSQFCHNITFEVRYVQEKSFQPVTAHYTWLLKLHPGSCNLSFHRAFTQMNLTLNQTIKNLNTSHPSAVGINEI
jgi:hypothetical protein